ncbi:MAG: hypothetical protein ACI814_004958, partial [Mariniblastus sp.]
FDESSHRHPSSSLSWGKNLKRLLGDWFMTSSQKLDSHGCFLNIKRDRRD